jgi:cholesterol transport system auxiliary component
MVTAVVMRARCLRVPRSTENPVHTFLLTLDESAWVRVCAPHNRVLHGVLVVGLPQAEAGFEQPRMAYLRAAV